MTTTTTHEAFELLFDSAPISLWLEDYSGLKRLFDAWRSQGVTDLMAYLKASPDSVQQCSAAIKVLKVNRQTLRAFAATSQEELIGRMHEVFRDDMLQQVVVEFDHLWHGRLEYAHQTVNYGLDGRRLDVDIRVRVLEGHEDTWARVMVSLEDVTERTRMRASLAASEQRARDLFHYSPVSLWVEDFSGVKALMDDVRAAGIEDFRVFISVHPEFVDRCMEQIRVIEVNRKTLEMFSATDSEELLGKLSLVFRDEMRNSFGEQLIDLWNGKTEQVREVINYSLNGELINIHMQFAVLPGFERSWGTVLISLVDITARKKAEAYLEYLGTHDSLTGLRNRAFYVDELNRISRKGPWPLGILAMDLNGLKGANDSEGHTAGDALLRRAGEVLTSATSGLKCCVARVGGDEFVVLMPGSDERMAAAIKERIDSMIELNNQFYPGQKLSLAIGVAACTTPGQVEAALQVADQAMYQAKASYYESGQFERRAGRASG